MTEVKRKPRLEFEDLSRREREVMYAVYKIGEVTAATLVEEMENPISYSGARRYLEILHDKGHLSMRKDGTRYCYRSVIDSSEAGLQMLKRVFSSFFGGSAAAGMAHFLEKQGGKKMSEDEAKKLERLLKKE